MNKENKFIKIYFDIAYDNKLSSGGKVLFSDLLQMYRSGLMANRWVSNVFLAQRYNVTPATIKKMIEELKNKEYIYTHVECANDKVIKRDIHIKFNSNDTRSINLDNDIAFTRSLKYIDKLIFAEINTHIRLFDICTISERYISARFDINLQTTRKALKNLENLDLISISYTDFGKEIKINKKNIKKVI